MHRNVPNFLALLFITTSVLGVCGVSYADSIQIAHVLDEEFVVDDFINAFYSPIPEEEQIPTSLPQTLKSAKAKAKVYPTHSLSQMVQNDFDSALAWVDHYSNPTGAPQRIQPRKEPASTYVQTVASSGPKKGPSKKLPQQKSSEVITSLVKDAPVKTAVVRVAPKPASHEVSTNTLVVKIGKRGHVTFEPQKLVLNEQSRSTKVSIEDSKGASLGFNAQRSLFVRNDSIIHFDEKQLTLLSRSHGDTEIYFVNNGKVHALPVSVTDDINTPSLKIPDELFAIEDLPVQNSARYRSPSKKVASKTTAEASNLARSAGLMDDPSIVSSKTATDFQSRVSEAGYVSMNLRVMDERSDVLNSVVYPLGGVKVSIAGVEFEGVTDRIGQIEMTNLPMNSRLIVRFDDPMGRVRASVREILTGSNPDGFSEDVLLTRHLQMESYENIIGIVKRSERSSLCGSVGDNVVDDRVYEGIAVTLDVEAEGPYFFNRFGYLDPEQAVTGKDGRFCFFNAVAGPVSLSFFDRGEYVSTATVGLVAGYMLDEKFYLDDRRQVRALLGARSTAHEHLSGNEVLANSLKLIDMIDLMPLGEGAPMTYLDEGLVGIDGGLSLHRGRTLALAQASEFENVLYPLYGGVENVTPLLPRGFVEDLSLYAEVPYFPDMGAVVVEHGRLHNQQSGAAEILLLDAAGSAVGEGFYFADEPATKAIFFNVEPGHYAVVVKDSQGYWLSADTVFVYNETISYSRTGSQLERSRNLTH